MTPDEAAAALDAIDLSHDPEVAHGNADDVLLAASDVRVRAAYQRCIERTGRWWFA